MNKVALITGVTGQDGSYLTDLLLSKGYIVFGMCRRHAVQSYDNLKEAMQNKRFQLVTGDLGDQVSLNQLIKETQPDEVYNLAAQSHVGTSFRQAEYTTDVTALGVLRMLEAIRHHKPDARFYQASSSEQFGKVVETPQTENTKFYPRSPYGVAKCYAHHITVNYRESYGLHASCGILFNHESIPKHMPVLIKQNEMVNILPIEDMFKSESHRYEGLRDEYSDIEIWDGEVWTKAVKGTAYKDVTKPMRCIQAPYGCYEATYDHVAFREDGTEVTTKDIVVGDKLFKTQYPEPIQKTRHDLEIAQAIGYLVGDGHISEGGDIRLTGLNKEELQRYAEIFASHFGWTYRISTFGPGSFEGSEEDVWHVDFKRGCRPWGRWLRKHVYTHFSEQKRVPQFILNADQGVKQAFFEGYYEADGRKNGSERYPYKGWTSESATLCLGLTMIVHELTAQDVKIELQYRDGKRYYYCNLRSPVRRGNKGQHLCKDLYEVTKTFDTESDGWFFDLTTGTQKFAVGPNLIQIHNSPRRGIEFVTRKITDTVARVKAGIIDKVGFGNLEAYRDWGYAPEYVEAIWLILQQDKPDDYVIGTGETHSVEEFMAAAFNSVDLDWRDYTYTDPRSVRPAEVDYLVADATKAKQKLNWEPKVLLPDLVTKMVKADIERYL